MFLNCGGSSALPRGLWYHYSYGTVAMYKGDWEKFGGFSDGFENKVTWGGEDWDIIDNAVRSGLEIERKRSPWVYHYYHTKAGMWWLAQVMDLTIYTPSCYQRPVAPSRQIINLFHKYKKITANTSYIACKFFVTRQALRHRLMLRVAIFEKSGHLRFYLIKNWLNVLVWLQIDKRTMI